jgi:hypothetical protein
VAEADSSFRKAVIAQCCPVELAGAKHGFLACAVQCASVRHMWLLSTSNVARAIEELNL